MQAANAAASSLHRNVTPASLSLNEKLGAVWLDGFAGVEVIDGAGGGVRSTVHVYEVGGGSGCRPRPWPDREGVRAGREAAVGLRARAGRERGRVELAQEASTPASLSLNEKLALVWLVGFAGVALIDGAGGGVESIVNVAVACDPAGVVFPALSVARACTTYEPPGGAGSGT